MAGPGPRGPRGPMPKIENPGKLLLRLMKFVFSQIWKMNKNEMKITVDVHIKTLRKKLNEYGAKIKTHVGLGYSYGE